MTTVIQIPGAILMNMAVQLGGTLQAGNTVVNLTYLNALTTLSVNDGADNLDDLLHSTAGHKIVFAHSVGACVASSWLNSYGPTSDIDDADLEFVLIGNPCRKYGGALRHTGPLSPYLSGWKNLVGASAIPAGTPYTVRDLARQYDGWCDWPNLSTLFSPKPLAVSNAMLGMSTLHVNYSAQTLDTGIDWSLVEGNITYLWSRTPNAPLNRFPSIGPRGGLVDDNVLRAIIEQGYSRPVDLEDPEGIPGQHPRTISDLDAIEAEVEYYRKYQWQL